MSQQAARRVRMGADDRRALLLDIAKGVFANRGYAPVGLAQIAEEAGVSKTLLYHYFPGGRPELYREVMVGLADTLIGQMRPALRAPRSPERRISGAIGAFFDFLDSDRAAYRLLFLEPWGSGESELVSQAMSLRIRIGSELAHVLSSTGASAPTTLSAAAATVGSLLHVAEIWLSGQIERSEAQTAAESYVLGGVKKLGLVEA